MKACTIAVCDDGSVRELVAYVVFKKQGVPTDVLQKFLSERVPSYCVPKHFVVMDSFPLNQNGKVDKRQLPKPETHPTNRISRAPKGELEEIVLRSFKKYTSRDYKINDCFFDSGGDSLKVRVYDVSSTSRNILSDVSLE